MARDQLHRSARVREAWTDVRDVGVGRRPDLTHSDKIRQIFATPWLDPLSIQRSYAGTITVSTHGGHTPRRQDRCEFLSLP